jgi:hypothetical protein
MVWSTAISQFRSPHRVSCTGPWFDWLPPKKPLLEGLSYNFVTFYRARWIITCRHKSMIVMILWLVKYWPTLINYEWLIQVPCKTKWLILHKEIIMTRGIFYTTLLWLKDNLIFQQTPAKEQVPSVPSRAMINRTQLQFGQQKHSNQQTLCIALNPCPVKICTKQSLLQNHHGFGSVANELQSLHVHLMFSIIIFLLLLLSQKPVQLSVCHMQ